MMKMRVTLNGVAVTMECRMNNLCLYWTSRDNSRVMTSAEKTAPARWSEHPVVILVVPGQFQSYDVSSA